MNKFVKHIVIPAVITVVGAGASAGITYGVTQSNANNQIEIARQQGYDNALTDNEFYKEQAQIYKQLYDEQVNVVNDYSAKIENLLNTNSQKETEINTLKNNLNLKDARIRALENDNTEKESQITNLTNEKSLLENRISTLLEDAENDALTISSKNSEINNLNIRIAELTASHEENTATINNLTTQKQELETQVVELQNNYLEKLNEITQLNIQVSNLQTQISTLQTTITLNTNTINSLNAQISAYQTQIANLQNEIANNTKSVKQYTDRIAELEKTISYYETYLSGIVASEQSLVKFIYNGSVYNTQVVNNGTYALISNPENTPYITFNYWMLNGEQVDPATYAITENVEFVANLTYSYSVKFNNGETNISSQIITSGECPALPEQTPTKEGYTFLGYSLNGVDIIEDPTTYAITQDTTFVAVFAKVYTVTFDYGTDEPITQQIKSGEYATLPEQPLKNGYDFDGWTINNNLIDVATYAITQNTTFIAKFTRLYNVTFDIGTSENISQQVRANEYATLPEQTPTKEGFTFLGYSLNGVDIIEDATNYPITQDTTFVAVFAKLYTVTFDNGIDKPITQQIKSGEYATLPEQPTKNGYDFDGWTINNNLIDVNTYTITQDTTFIAKFTKLNNVTFMVNDEVLETQQVRNGDYVENANSNYTWTLNGSVINFAEYPICSDVTFIAKTDLSGLENTTFFGLTSFNGSNVWTDGTNYYVIGKYSDSGYTFVSQYVLDKETSTWTKISWKNVTFAYNDIWTDGTNYYYSSGSSQYVLNISTNVCYKKTWTGLSKFNGRYVWTDGTNYYYSNDSQQYVLDKETSTWNEKTWLGLTSFNGSDIWTDGTNYYYSYGSQQYVLDIETSTWNEKTWLGLTSFNGSDIWTDGTNYYHSNETEHYMFY